MLGHNGAGKSTLRRVVDRYHVLESGRVTSAGDGASTVERTVRQALAV
ncbi:ATP-binding cassette domain-containing protein [Micromonospora craniellae]|uniref:ATP-binding cassette domain-containing protein n=1 Tax=Micromonospora craniellae TaxID=2294034 RepID=A0A372G100_9ACTN|nr:ATP-binding cassette domain-containing protein [Micromonospora craniellae]QOC91667.1 ATP-binding cassette domain-containing protein [Micromonospora craniellae]RFS46554.1 ATP-binding cassette domain-containing protein [Micromonospora craniellae]